MCICRRTHQSDLGATAIGGAADDVAAHGVLLLVQLIQRRHRPPRHLSRHHWPPRHLSRHHWPPHHLSRPHWPPRHLSRPHWPLRHLSRPHWPPTRQPRGDGRLARGEHRRHHPLHTPAHHQIRHSVGPGHSLTL